MREVYQAQLDAVLSDLVWITGEVRSSVSEATDALLHADLPRAEAVISGDQAIDDDREQLEDDSFEILARQAPVAGDLRMIVAALRMVGDLERMGDLSVHVAKVARRRYPSPAVPPDLVPVVVAMADTADQMIATAASVLTARDVDTALGLEAADDEMDRLRRTVFRRLLDEEWEAGLEAAVDVALVGGYYERIGDHAVSIARRLVFIVTGERQAPA